MLRRWERARWSRCARRPRSAARSGSRRELLWIWCYVPLWARTIQSSARARSRIFSSHPDVEFIEAHALDFANDATPGWSPCCPLPLLSCAAGNRRIDRPYEKAHATGRQLSSEAVSRSGDPGRGAKFAAYSADPARGVAASEPAPGGGACHWPFISNWCGPNCALYAILPLWPIQ